VWSSHRNAIVFARLASVFSPLAFPPNDLQPSCCLKRPTCEHPRDWDESFTHLVQRKTTISLDALPAFNEYRRRLLKERRESEQARSLATLIQIREDPGDGKSADRTVQLKAIQVMESAEGKEASWSTSRTLRRSAQAT
jgi:hypothetical protein